MINLIPNQQKKEMFRNFYYRLTAVLFLALGFCLFIACITLVPAYFLVSSKSDLINSKLNEEKTATAILNDKESKEAIATLDKQLTLIEKAQANKFLVSEKIINQIIQKQVSQVKINEISLDTSPAGDRSVSIRGTASSRERLLFFRKTLEDNSSFKQVNLPISNFIKGSNIQFSLTVIPSL